VVIVYAIQPGAAAAPAPLIDDLTMFKVEETPDGGGLLTLTSQDERGAFWQTTYRMTPAMKVAFVGGVNRELDGGELK
jgi:hypothetical protein